MVFCVTLQRSGAEVVHVNPAQVAAIEPLEGRKNKCMVYITGGAALRVVGTCEEILAKLGWAALASSQTGTQVDAVLPIAAYPNCEPESGPDEI
jgi:hypothetical protein